MPPEHSLSQEEFDRDFRLVTSYILPPFALAAARLSIAFFSLITIIYTLVRAVNEGDGDGHFSYFTNLTFVGICAYFFASGTQTLFYARNLGKLDGAGAVATESKAVSSSSYPLQRWPRILRYFHVLLTTTIITFPIIVTIVYWVLLASSSSFSKANAFSNISKHILDAAFGIFEISLTNVPPPPWLDLPVTLVILAGYIGVAYVTYETQGFYTYSFLNTQINSAGKLAGYIVGIALGQVIIFVAVRYAIIFRSNLVAKRLGREGGYARTSHDGSIRMEAMKNTEEKSNS